MCSVGSYRLNQGDSKCDVKDRIKHCLEMNRKRDVYGDMVVYDAGFCICQKKTK